MGLGTLTISLKKYFYFYASLLIAGIVAFGFSHTIGPNLLHSSVPRPKVLYIHAAVFFGWVLFFILQTALVRSLKIKIHRVLGWFGAIFGLAIPVLGISTAITMAQFRGLTLDARADLIVQFFDMLAFSILFFLAFYWRKRAEFHRRFIFIATCVLTSAAFGRFPPQIIPRHFFYVAVDLLVCMGVLCDLVFLRHIHKIYLYTLFLMALGQATVMYIDLHKSPFWIQISHALVQ